MTGSAPRQPWTVGALIADRFRLLSRVDNAPLGERWRADDGGVVVHLTVIAARADLPAARRDATLAALRDFGHPNAASVLDAGLFDGALYVATAISAGQSVRAWAAGERTRAGVSLRDARAVFVQVTQCLAVSHRAGVPLVHGFALADSVAVERRGDVHLVARLEDLALLTLAAVDPAALPPGAPAGVPTEVDDVRGAGALLAEMLTDVKLVGSPEPDALAATLAAARPDVDPSVWKIVRACLSADPTLRPAGMERVRELVRGANWAPCEIRTAAPAAAPAAPLTAEAPAAPQRARIVAVTSSAERRPSPPPSPRSFASPEAEATVLTVAVAPRAAPLAAPLAARVAALPRAAQALFEDESTTLHVSSLQELDAAEDTAPGFDEPHHAPPTPIVRAPRRPAAPPAAVDQAALLAREETAPDSAGFRADALALPDPLALLDAPTLLPTSRGPRPATIAPPTPGRAPVQAPARNVVVSPLLDDALHTEEHLFTAPRAATMPPPATRFVAPPSPLAPDDGGPATMPVMVRATPPPAMPPPAVPPRHAPPSTRAERDHSLLEPPLVWWLLAAVAGVVTLLIAAVTTSR